LGQTGATAGSDRNTQGWWQVKTAAGPAWLFGDYVRAAGPLDGVPIVESTVEIAPVSAAASAEIASPQNVADSASSLSIFSLRPARGSR
jgi:hypothetical protein